MGFRIKRNADKLGVGGECMTQRMTQQKEKLKGRRSEKGIRNQKIKLVALNFALFSKFSF